MASEADVSQALIDNAAGPQKASGDSGSVEQHPLPDQIAADRYLKANDGAVKNPQRGLRFTRIVPPGAS